MKECWIIGSGIAGVAAAWTLEQSGQYRPIFIDKARGAGGRMSTRRTDHGKFDHGAQFFKVRAKEFRDFLELGFQNDLIRHWSDYMPSEDENSKTSEKFYCGKNGMNSIAKFYISHYNWQLYTQEKVSRFEKQAEGINIVTENNRFFAAHTILTAPVPQAIAILESSDVKMSSDEQEALNSVAYDPCFALLLALDRPSSLSQPGALELKTSPFAWIADNYQKGITENHTVTIHTDTDFSNKYLEADLEEVKSILLQKVQPYITQKILHSQIHRWRYSRVKKSYPAKYFHVQGLENLYLAGDGFGYANVESAALSGIAAAKQLIEHNKEKSLD